MRARMARRTLYVAAGIHTLDDAWAVAGNDDESAPRALLVEDDRILWIGPTTTPTTGPTTGTLHSTVADRIVDLGDAWVTPAFVDAHVHATATGLALDGVDLDGATGLAGALSQVRAHVAEADPAVVLGVRWDDSTWPEGRPPTAEEVAAAAPGRPVLLMRVDAHSCVVDPTTLARLPLDRLAGVDRDADGHPTGWLVEEAAQAARALVYDRLPPAQVHRARAATCARAAALGIGSLHEMGHPGLSGLDDATAWATGTWPVEVLVWWAELDAAAGPAAGLRPGGDLFLDGSIGSRTAAVSAGYRDGDGTGRLFHPDGAVAAFFTDCTRAGLGAGVHAIGDAAVEQAVAALEAAAAACGTSAVRTCRHRIEHAELLRPGHARRMGALGVVASVQPAFDAAWGGRAGLYERRLGADVALASNPFAALAAAGVTLAFGSDSTVTPLDPWGAVAAAEHHRGGQGVSRRAALVAHTLGGRHAAGQDDVGALAPGARADLAVWAGDPLRVPDVRGLRCLATVVAGRSAYGDVGGEGEPS